MKKLLLLFLFLLLPLSVDAEIPDRPTTSGFVFDYQGVIDDEVEQELNAFSEAMNKQGIMQLFLLTVPTIGELEPYEYGVKVIRDWGIGEAATNNGMLIFVTTEQGEGKNTVRIAVGQGLEGDYPDGKLGRMIDDYMAYNLSNGDYTSAFANVVNEIRSLEMVEHEWGESVSSIVEWTWSDTLFLLVFLLIFLVVIYLVIKWFRSDNSSGGSVSSTYSYSSSDYDTSSSNSNSDSFSGGGGDSAGGGADRNF